MNRFKVIDIVKTWKVEYFGNLLYVPIEFVYLCFDENGDIWAFDVCPVVSGNTWVSGNDSSVSFMLVGNVDVNGYYKDIDWKESLVFIKDTDS